jgi:thymidine phosphorylase
MNDASRTAPPATLKAKRLGIQTVQEAHAFVHRDNEVSRSEGFSRHARVLLTHGAHTILAELYHVTSGMIGMHEIGLSDGAWHQLAASEGAPIGIDHAPPVLSLGDVRGKIYGRRLDIAALRPIMKDIEAGRYSNIQLSAFITACAAQPLDHDETCALTQAMVEAGERISWPRHPVVDKHSVGGLPGNRTTPIVVAIAAACDLTIPKTSSRAITSPAGTADTMETLAPVDLDIAAMRRVVEKEGGCVVWGGAVHLSPTDDVLIRIERVLDIDSEGQLVASILSKKIAAGITHLVVDMPVGPTAKVRSHGAADALAVSLADVGEAHGLKVRTVVSDGTQPVGRGIGPALEARDVLAVLMNAGDAPADLREHAVALAANILELGGAAPGNGGRDLAMRTLADGKAWVKFQRICEAQGGMRRPPVARQQHQVAAPRAGRVWCIDNRRLARIAKLAGAPEDRTAGIDLHIRVDTRVEAGQPLYTVHADTPGQIEYALAFAHANPDIIGLG